MNPLDVYNELRSTTLKSSNELNESQLNGIRCMEDRLVVIQGPPGTGKTSVIHSMFEIYKASNPPNKKLIGILMAHSHAACDRIQQDMLNRDKKCLRIAYSEKGFRLCVDDPSKFPRKFFFPISSTDEEDYSSAENEEDPSKSPEKFFFPTSSTDQEDDSSADCLRKYISELDYDLIVVNYGQLPKFLRLLNEMHDRLNMDDYRFVVFNDEAGQCDLVSALSILSLPNVWCSVWVGDQNQLPPTVKCDTAIELGMQESFLQMWYECMKEKMIMLDVNYRNTYYMVELLNSLEIYPKRLKSFRTCPNRSQSGLYFYDLAKIAPTKYYETGISTRIQNKTEEDIISAYCKHYMKANPTKTVLVITPYNSTKKSLTKRLLKCKNVIVRTVDESQGAEYEIVIYGLVRSNPKHKVGFTADKFRNCVALSRASEILLIIGDSRNRVSDPFFKKLYSFLG